MTAGFAFRSGWTQPPLLEPANSYVPKAPASSAAAGYPGLSGSNAANSVGAGFSPVRIGAAADGEQSLGKEEEEDVSSSLRFEGWLGKLSTGKISRWQRRYFILEGRRLQYFAKPGDPTPKKRLDLRLVHTVRAKTPADARCRILELHLSSGKVRQLRADDPAAMRQWLQFLEAARLLEGRFDAEDGAGSDDGELSDGWETASTASSADSVASLPTQPKTPTPKPISDINFSPKDEGGSSIPNAEEPYSNLDNVKQSSTDPSTQLAAMDATEAASSLSKSAPPRSSKKLADCPESIPDMPELDVAELDKNLEVWFHSFTGKRGSRNSDVNSASTGIDVIQDVWKALGATTTCTGPDDALAALAERGANSETLNEGIESVISEFLSRLQSRVSLYLDDATLPSQEIEEITSWWLLDAKPSLDAFEKGAIAKGWKVTAWRSSAEEIERALLSEWEVRSCEELSPVEEQCPQSESKVGVLLKPQSALIQIEKWGSHALARDRAANVLIASLNSALRTGRQSLRRLLPQSPQEVSCNKRRILPRWLRVRRLTLRSVSGATAPTSSVALETIMDGAASLVSDAAALTAFCSQAFGPVSRAAGCAGVLGALSGAFGQLCAEACNVLADAVVSQDVCIVRFNSRDLQQTPHRGPLGPSIAAAEAFLHQAFRNAPAAGAQHAATKIATALNRHWMQAFVRAKPRLSNCPALPAAIEVDERSLRTMAYHWGANEAQAAAPLGLVRELLGKSSPELQAIAVGRLKALLGEDLGASVETVARGALR